MLRFYSAPIYNTGMEYFLDSFTGSLLVKDHVPVTLQKSKSPVPKVIKALDYSDNPYSLNAISSCQEKVNDNKFIQFYANALTHACKYAFFLGLNTTRLVRPYYESTYDAILAYRALYPGKMQKDLCLPRTLFAASLSKTFKDSGVIFIGVFLPSRSMHAWIIENQTQPDPNDQIWTNYQPVAALY